MEGNRTLCLRESKPNLFLFYTEIDQNNAACLFFDGFFFVFMELCSAKKHIQDWISESRNMFFWCDKHGIEHIYTTLLNLETTKKKKDYCMF